MCAQDWLRSNRAPLIVEEFVEEVEQIEKGNVYQPIIYFEL